MLMFLLFVRVLMALLSQSWYVPDETWQSVEVAHHLVFGTGYKTWEWLIGIRSWLHPLLFAAPLALLKLTGLDSQYAVILAPKIIQALLTTVCEYFLIKRWRSELGDCLAVLVIFSWHSLYTCSRTLINTVEYCITCAALSLYPKKHKGKTFDGHEVRYVPIVCLGFMMRPTLALVWAPISAIHCFNALRYGKIREVLKVVAMCVLIITSCIIIDSFFYQNFTIVPLNFFMVNVYNNLGVNYGTHPWHWYFSAALPSLIGPLVVPLLLALPVSPLHLGLPLVVNLVCLSCLPHKEMRFLQSCLPFCFLILAKQIKSYRHLYQRIFKTVFIIMNILLALYLSLVHQRGVVDAAIYLGKSGPDLTVHGRNTVSLILMPCHSTPLYSHMHTNITVRFLQCTPNLESDPNYREEADIFYEDSQSWLEQNYPMETPEILLYFDVLQQNIMRTLQNYQTCANFFHTMLPEGRIGSQVIVAARKDVATALCNNSNFNALPKIFAQFTK